MRTDPNPPAFPTKRLLERDVDGMTLRDYFAAKALQGSVASGMRFDDRLRAEWAYAQADAMLVARVRD